MPGTWRYRLDSLGTWTLHPGPAGPAYSMDVLELPLRGVRMFQAVHEAGHAVVAAALDLIAAGAPTVRLHTVRLYPPMPGLLNVGHAYVSWQAGTDWFNLAAWSASGERAADRWLRDEGLWTPLRAWVAEVSAAADRRNIDTYDPRFQLAWSHDQHQALVQQGVTAVDYADIQADADMVLTDLWPVVTTVARLLASHGSLTGDQVRALTARLNPTSFRWATPQENY